jgi:hypothetical protein
MARGRDLGDDTWLTQWGAHDNLAGGRVFRNRPRPQVDVDGVSLFLGRLRPADASRRLRVPFEPKVHVVRYVRVGEFRACGFTVTHTPTKRNPAHVSVAFPGEWADREAERFDACCSDEVREEGPGDG